MSECVRLIVQRQVRTDEIVEALVAAGARSVEVDRRSGDSYAGVDGYFYLHFDDPEAPGKRRTAFGFQASRSEEHEEGWTRVQLGADERGRFFVGEIGEILGGNLFDNRTQEEVDFDAARPSMAA